MLGRRSPRPTIAGSDSMAKPMWRASSCRMRRQTWRSTASFGGLRQHAEQRDGEGLGDELQADRLEIPRRGAEQRVEDLLDVAAERIGLAVEPQRRDSAAAPRCAAPRRRPASPGTAWRPAPATFSTSWLHTSMAPCSPCTRVESRQRVTRRLSSTRSASDMASQKRVPWMSTRSSAISPPSPSSGSCPVDIGGGVPLVDLGLLVEPAQVGLLAVVVVEKVRGVARLDLVPVGHAFLHVVLMEEG